MKIIDSEKRLSHCNFIKTILMVIVVFYHSILYWSGTWLDGQPVYSSYCLNIFAKWLNTIHIYGFTLVSGYIYYSLKCEKGKYNDFYSFLKNKAQRLLIPYVFTCVVWVIPITVYFNHIGMEDIFKKFVLGTSPSQLWFLLMLFNVFIIAYLMTSFWESHPALSLFVILACYGVGLLGELFIPNVYMIFTSLRYILFFWIGFNLRKYKDCILWKIPATIYFILHILLFAGLRFFQTKEGIVFELINTGGNIALNIIGAIMAFMMLQKLANSINWNNKFFVFIEKRSMSVYLFHQQIIYFTIMSLNGILNPWLHSLVNFAVSFVLSIIISSILKKFKLTRILIGEKQ